MKKLTKYILYVSLIILALLWISKQLGYPLTWYGLNGYYNITKKTVIENQIYRLQIPFWQWKIYEESDKSISLEGVTPSKTFVYALIRKDIGFYNSQNIKKMCEDKVIIEVNKKKGFNEHNIYCNNSSKKMKSYRIYWIKNKIFVFMENYNSKYESIYDKLLSTIEIK